MTTSWTRPWSPLCDGGLAVEPALLLLPFLLLPLSPPLAPLHLHHLKMPS